MNMNGGFNITDYNSIYQEAVAEYASTIDHLRIAANEFAENYKAGKKEAHLAYRQLNYYYVEKNGVKTNMGDYMLSFPEKNDDFADILFKGNPNILNNIRILLSMGVPDGGALVERIKAKVNDERVYGKKEYFEDAKEIVGKVKQLKKILRDAQSQIDEINADPDMTDEEKENSSVILKYTATLIMGFEELLATIPYGDTNYNELLSKTNVDYTSVYPLIDAMTPGQRAMAVSGQLHSVFVYNAVELSDAEVAEKIAEIEKEYEPMSVYHGTDMTLIEGAIGVTSDAIREEAATGQPWQGCITGIDGLDITIASLFGVGGAALSCVSAIYLIGQIKQAMKPMDATDKYTLWYSDQQVKINLERYANQSEMLSDANASHMKNIDQINAKYAVSTSTVVLSSIGLAVGIAMMVFSIYTLVQIYNKYNTEYTEIPTTMVDAVETLNGKRYIRYNVVQSLYQDGGKVSERQGDVNGYDGFQWNAIYFTKNYEAGKCMTASGYFIENESGYGKYTPVAKFGSNTCYDLNAHNGQKNKDQIYIAFGNSNKKKAAETSVPTVVGSMFSYGGTIALSSAIGLSIGMGVMALIKRKKEND